MITKEHAEFLAQQVLQQARAESEAVKNAQAGKVPFFYRCAELEVFPPWERMVIVRRAAQERWIDVDRRFLVIFGVFLMLSVAMFVYFLNRDSLPYFSWMYFLPLSWLMRITIVRHRIKQLAKSSATVKPVAANCSPGWEG